LTQTLPIASRSFSKVVPVRKIDMEDFDQLMNEMNKKINADSTMTKLSGPLDRSKPYVHQVKESMAYIRSPCPSWKNNQVVHITEN